MINSKNLFSIKIMLLIKFGGIFKIYISYIFMSNVVGYNLIGNGNKV